MKKCIRQLFPLRGAGVGQVSEFWASSRKTTKLIGSFVGCGKSQEQGKLRTRKSTRSLPGISKACLKVSVPQAGRLQAEPLPNRFQNQAGPAKLRLPHWTYNKAGWRAIATELWNTCQPRCHAPRGLKHSQPAKRSFLSEIPGCVWPYRPCVDTLHSRNLEVAARGSGELHHHMVSRRLKRPETNLKSEKRLAT